MGVNIRMLVAQIVGMFIVFALALFVPAGTLVWPAGWAFLILFFGFTVAISYWLLKNNPGLLTERLTGTRKADQKVWDKVFLLFATGIFYGWLALIALDAVRFRWSHVPGWLQGVGVLLLLGSFYLFFITFRENSFLSPAVRIQAERGHTVITTGPYRYVRHPMYAAVIPYTVGTTLLLGSWFGLIPVLWLWLGMAQRAIMEENTLREELLGYDSYMQQVKYRLIPGVW
jgi:protein-S-isoprenylcysteine O-methyltransferase Ste14